ncbi:hypothetical protein ACJJTC_016907 [Scirpophaga incertulas]
MESRAWLVLGVKVKPGPIERHKIDNFNVGNSVDNLRLEAEKRINLPANTFELIYHGKILQDNITLQDCGVKNGEMIHVIKKKVQPVPHIKPIYTDADLQQLNALLRTLGCTPNAPGWTRAMQLLNDEAAMAEIIEHAPSLADDCVILSILHEVELLAALGANVQTMRRGADAHPDLPNALRHLMRLVRTYSSSTSSSSDNVPISGFAYSLEALSEDEDADDEDTEEGERTPITQEQLAAALQAATASATGQENLLRLLQATDDSTTSAAAESSSPTQGARRPIVTPEMISEAIDRAMNRTINSRRSRGNLMDYSAAASSSQSPVARDGGYTTQLSHMHDMGLLDDALNLRALLICSGDVNAAINLVFSGAIADD